MEAGGLNLYGFCLNNTINRWDYLGMDSYLAGLQGRQSELESQLEDLRRQKDDLDDPDDDWGKQEEQRIVELIRYTQQELKSVATALSRYGGTYTLNLNSDGLGSTNWAAYGPFDAPNTTTPWELGWQWLTGDGPRNQVFGDGDPMTQLLQRHGFIQGARDMIASNIATMGPLSGMERYDLGGIEGVPKYIGDYSTLLTGGLTGNLAVTYLGSYNLHYEVATVNLGGTAVVNFTVVNASTINSATHPPFFGYLPGYYEYIGAPLNALFQSGPMSPTVQIFNWTETIPWAPLPPD